MNIQELDQLNNNLKKSDSYLGVGFAMMYILIGVLLGVLVMYLTHKGAYRHYNICQEKVLLETIAELKTEKTWYIKEDSSGKIKVIELSKQELDSLNCVK